ncbi:MAG: phosphoenolpyruvate--protein phosphotransferase [Planctomycetota bacterium]
MRQNTENLKLTGYGISAGLGMGTAYVYHDVLQRVESVYCFRSESEVEKECQRLDTAIDQVMRDLAQGEEKVTEVLDENFARIFRAHRQMLKDPSLREEMRAAIRKDRVNAECVVSGVFRRLEGKFRQFNNSSHAERADDVRDLAERVLRTLVGQATHELETLPENTVVVASRLLPSDTVHFSRQSVSAVVIERGGAASHAAILTRELGIPAVSGIDNAAQRIPPGRTVLVDGCEGSVLIEPHDAERKAFRDRQAEIAMRRTRALEQAAMPARTRDGTEVVVMANISCRDDAELAKECGADGVGLYRTEKLYFGRSNLPDENELLESIQDTLAPFGNEAPVTLRLLDTGGDKLLPFLDHPTESSPLLGRRGVRFLLDFEDLLVTQLRCFIRLSQQRVVRILVPMVTLPSDMQRLRELYERAARDLGCDHPPPLGSMIETPAAAVCADAIAPVSDFLSAGTNDLTQYTMAADRENVHVTDYFLQDYPAIFRLVECMVRAAGDKSAGVCGELAGQLDATAELLEIGVGELSVNPLQIPFVKQSIREVDLHMHEPHVGAGSPR